jgi:hypothetical protein
VEYPRTIIKDVQKFKSATFAAMDGFSKHKNLAPEDYYYSEQGFLVFTEKYLLKRGYCCQNGCKHCPYGFDKSKGRIIKKQKPI